ncbi:hypothetical protein EB796_010561 [Bugula neritina]|uniref:Uncharacterized protein n=1 Tax=Bugula neritina TaxID=10212 RepID=A0A7J7JZP1_BUGNE|nr:hypothetical protein EB796_010561 [Bugula neritina]
MQCKSSQLQQSLASLEQHQLIEKAISTLIKATTPSSVRTTAMLFALLQYFVFSRYLSTSSSSIVALVQQPVMLMRLYSGKEISLKMMTPLKIINASHTSM